MKDTDTVTLDMLSVEAGKAALLCLRDRYIDELNALGGKEVRRIIAYLEGDEHILRFRADHCIDALKREEDRELSSFRSRTANRCYYANMAWRNQPVRTVRDLVRGFNTYLATYVTDLPGLFEEDLARTHEKTEMLREAIRHLRQAQPTVENADKP